MKHIANKITTAGLGLLLVGCTGQELPDDGRGVVSLQPHFLTGTTDTRSLVNGTASATGNGNIHQVNLYVTKKADNAVYPGITGGTVNGLSQFTYDGKWTGSPAVNLHNEEARIYAYYPVNVKPTHVPGGDLHTIQVIDITADQTFNGANTWECNVTDYLYGSTKQDADNEIIASNQSFKPAIWLRHALAQVVFKMQSASGRPVDAYDYIKKITMKTTGSPSFLTGSGTMQLKDGVIASLNETANELTFTPSANPVQCGANSQSKVVAYGLVAPLSSTLSNVTLTIELGAQNNTDNKRILSVSSEYFKVQWLKGKRYVYNLTLTNRNIEVNEIKIAPWTDKIGTGDLRPDGF